MDKISLYSSELIRKLDKETPERCYDLNLTKEENIFYAGQRFVIEGLLMIQENQKNEGLDNE